MDPKPIGISSSTLPNPLRDHLFQLRHFTDEEIEAQQGQNPDSYTPDLTFALGLHVKRFFTPPELAALSLLRGWLQSKTKQVSI